MRSYYIIVRDDNKAKIKLAEDIKKSILEKGGKCEYGVHGSLGEIPEGTECILTIGGDGCVIRAAQHCIGLDIPILGINYGHMGYLCDLDKDSVFQAIDRLFQDDYSIENRMMVQGGIEGSDEEIHQALNDIIIRSTEDQHVTRLSVYVNDQYLFAYDCDGIIISTPTGSTAYNLSAHGPIVNPETNLLLLTPINPHTLNARSIVLDSEDVVAVKLIPRSSEGDEKALVTYDGRHRSYLREHEKLVVSKASASIKMVMLSEETFLDRIRNKMQA